MDETDYQRKFKNLLAFVFVANFLIICLGVLFFNPGDDHILALLLGYMSSRIGMIFNYYFENKKV